MNQISNSKYLWSFTATLVANGLYRSSQKHVLEQRAKRLAVSLFDIKSYTNLLFYCTDVFANKSIVDTFAIFYMNNGGYLCVEREENFQHAEYDSLRVDFILYLCNDLDVLLSDRKLNGRFYASAALNSKEHLPRVYDSDFNNADAQTVALFSSSHFCFQ